MALQEFVAAIHMNLLSSTIITLECQMDISMKWKTRFLHLLCITLAIAGTALAQGKSSGIDVSSLDRSVRPQDDFFRFVNGTWVDKTAIPDDLSNYGSFAILREKSQAALKEIIEQAAAQKTAPPGSSAQKVGDLYGGFMDTARIEALGIKPLEGELAKIGSLGATAELATTFARFAQIGVRTLPFAITIAQALRNAFSRWKRNLPRSSGIARTIGTALRPTIK